MSLLIAISIACSFVVGLILVPFVRGFALKVGMVDDPDAERKLHKQPIALGGGIAVFVSVVVTFIVLLYWDRYSNSGAYSLGFIDTKWYSLFIAAGAMLVVGLVDDRWKLRGRQKLLLQILIISALVGAGTNVEKLGFFGYELNLGPFSYPITLLWLLIAVNALNLIDGADGMATTAGCIISFGLACLSLQYGASLHSLVALSLAGGLLAFLVYNKPPATIFLGDAGSMMIGLFVGVLAVWSSVKESTVLASAPVAILAIPLFDSTAAIVRRWLTGRSIYTTDRGHLHHLLQEKFGSIGMLLVVALLCMFTTLLAVLSAQFDIPWLSAIGVVGVLVALVATRSFGNAECRLILSKSQNITRSFFVRPSKTDSTDHYTIVPIQGCGEWDTIWEPLQDFAKSHGLSKVRIDLSMAWIHENFHATWTNMRLPERAFQMTVKVPLFANRGADGERVNIGKLELIAPGEDAEAYSRVSDFLQHIEDLQPEVDAIISCLQKRDASSDSQQPAAEAPTPAKV